MDIVYVLLAETPVLFIDIGPHCDQQSNAVEWVTEVVN